MDGGGDDRVVVDLPGLDQQPVLEVREAAALADPRAAEVDRDRAAEDEVDLGHLLQGDHLAVAQRSLDRRRLPDAALTAACGVEQPERVLVAQARDGHHELLALLEREAPGVGLGRVRIGLDHLGALPQACWASFSAASLAPAKFGIRPSAPGNRETPSRSIARQTARLDLVLGTHSRENILAQKRADGAISHIGRPSGCRPRRHECGRGQPAARAPARGGHARAAARDRARPAPERLGPLRARRGLLGRDPGRVLLPLLVPDRGRGDRQRALRQRRAAGLQPLRRAAAGRGDDRQGDPRGAPATRGRST